MISQHIFQGKKRLYQKNLIKFILYYVIFNPSLPPPHPSLPKYISTPPAPPVCGGLDPSRLQEREKDRSHGLFFFSNIKESISPYTQGINQPASFRFLQRLSVIFAETVRNLLLPVGTTVLEKWLPADTVRVTLLPAKSVGRKQNHADNLCRKPFCMYRSLGRKQEIADSLGGSQIRCTVSAGSEN